MISSQNGSWPSSQYLATVLAMRNGSLRLLCLVGFARYPHHVLSFRRMVKKIHLSHVFSKSRIPDTWVTENARRRKSRKK